MTNGTSWRCITPACLRAILKATGSTRRAMFGVAGSSPSRKFDGSPMRRSEFPVSLRRSASRRWRRTNTIFSANCFRPSRRQGSAIAAKQQKLSEKHSPVLLYGSASRSGGEGPWPLPSRGSLPAARPGLLHQRQSSYLAHHHQPRRRATPPASGARQRADGSADARRGARTRGFRGSRRL